MFLLTALSDDGTSFSPPVNTQSHTCSKSSPSLQATTPINSLPIQPILSSPRVSCFDSSTASRELSQSPPISQPTVVLSVSSHVHIPKLNLALVSSINQYPMTIRSKTNSLKPKVYLITTIILLQPLCYKDGIPEWEEAMAKEFQALINNRTCELVLFPNDANPIGSKWVYITKLKCDGLLDKYKTRMVAKGMTWWKELTIFETCSPIVKPQTIKVELTLSLSFHWPLKQLDVNNAFLNENLQEVVYMK